MEPLTTIVSSIVLGIIGNLVTDVVKERGLDPWKLWQRADQLSNGDLLWAIQEAFRLAVKEIGRTYLHSEAGLRLRVEERELAEERLKWLVKDAEKLLPPVATGSEALSKEQLRTFVYADPTQLEIGFRRSLHEYLDGAPISFQAWLLTRLPGTLAFAFGETIKGDGRAERAWRGFLRLLVEDVGRRVDAVTRQMEAEWLLYRVLAADRPVWRYYLANFVGRTDVLAAIDAFLAGDGGYFPISGEAGRGKTALAIHLAAQRGYLLHLLGAPWAGEPRVGLPRNTPDEMLRNLGYQIIERFGLEHVRLHGNVRELREAFTNMLSRLEERVLAPENKLVVVLDGLDEADETEGVSVWDVLPDRLPRYAYFILTGRPTVDFARLPVKQLPLSLPPLDVEAVRVMLVTAGDQVARNDAFLSQVVAVSGGDPLYLRHLVEDIVEWGEAAATRLVEQPGEIRAYYAEQFRQLDKGVEEARYEVEAFDILWLLALAREPLNREQIVRITGMKSVIFDRALKPIRRFTLGETRYSLIHPIFREVTGEQFAARVVIEERMAFVERLLAWCRGWQQAPGADREYALRHLAAHLTELGKTKDLYALIEDRAWYEAKRGYDPSGQAYIADVDLALAAAGVEPPDLPRAAAYSLLRATVSSMATTIPIEGLQVLVQLGHSEQAMQYADLITDPGKRINAYKVLGEQFQGQGQVTLAQKLAHRAIEVLATIPDLQWQWNVLMDIAQFVCRTQDSTAIDAIFATMQRFSDSNYSDAGVQCLAEALAETNDLERATTLVVQISQEPRRAVTLTNLAKAATKHGNPKVAYLLLDQALELSNRSPNESLRAQILTRIAEAFLELENIDRALEILQTSIEIATTLESTESDEPLDRAIKIIGCIADRAIQTHDLKKLLRLQDIAQAIHMTSKQWRVSLGRIGAALATIGEGQRAGHLASQIIIQTNSLDRRLDSMKREGLDWFQAKLYSTSLYAEAAQAMQVIASALARSGDVTAARSSLSSALEALKHIQSERWKANLEWALRDVAVALVQISDQEGLDKALSMLKAVEDSAARNFVLRDIAKALVQQGRLDDALALIGQITETDSRTLALRVLADTLYEMGQFAQALDLLERAQHELQNIENLPSRARELQQQSLLLAKQGYMDRAISLAQTIPGEKAAETLFRLAQLQLPNNPDEARATVERAFVLANINFQESDKADEARDLLAKLLEKTGEMDLVRRLIASMDQSPDSQVLINALELVNQGHVDNAFALVESFEASLRIPARFFILDRLFEKGEIKQAKQLLAQTLQEVEADESSIAFREWGYPLVEGLAQVRDEDGLAKMVELTRGIEEERGRRAEVLKKIITLSGQIGARTALERAVGIVESFDSDRNRAGAYKVLGEAFITAGDRERGCYFLDKSLSIAENIKLHEEYYLSDLAMICARVDDFDRMMAVLKKEYFFYTERARTALNLVRLLADKGDLERIYALFDFLNYFPLRMQAFTAVIRAADRYQKRSELEELARLFEEYSPGELSDKREEEYLAATYEALTVAMIHLRAFDRVPGLLNHIADSVLRAGACVAAARALADVEEKTLAREMGLNALELIQQFSQTIEHSLQCVAILSPLVKAFAQIGDNSLTQQALDQAMSAAQDLEQQRNLVNEVRLVGLVLLAQHLCQLEDTHRLQQVLTLLLSVIQQSTHRKPIGVKEFVTNPLIISDPELVESTRKEEIYEDFTRRYFWCPFPSAAILEGPWTSLPMILNELPPSMDIFKRRLVYDAFNWSRDQGQDVVWTLITAFTPVYEKLGILAPLAERILAVEKLWRSPYTNEE